MSRSVAFGACGPGWVGNRFSEWGPGDDASAGQAFGWSWSFTGTSTAEDMADAATLREQLPRMAYASATGADEDAGLITASAVCWRGASPRFGGFHFGVRFALGASIDGSRAFVGLAATDMSVVKDDDPSTFPNTIGLGFDAGDDDGDGWYLIRRDGAAVAAEKIAVGAAAPRDGDTVFDLSIVSAPNGDDIIVMLTNPSTGEVALKATAYDEVIPDDDVFLFPHVEVGNAATGESATIEVISMFLDVPDGAKTVPSLLGKSGVYDVRDFGATGDGVTDDGPAFANALEAIGWSGGGTLLVSPGDYYFVESLLIDLRRTGSILVRGVAPGSGHNQSRMKFAAYKGIRVIGPGSDNVAAFENLDLLGGNAPALDPAIDPIHHPVREEGITTPPRVVPKGPRFTVPGATLEYYYENVNEAAMAVGDEPLFAATQKVDPSTPRLDSHRYELGDVVRAEDHFEVFFVCTQAGTTDAMPPVWDYDPGDSTNGDGSVNWLAVDAAGYFVPDNGASLDAPDDEPIWACRVVAGIYSEARISVRRVLIQHFLNSGIHIQAPLEGEPGANTVRGFSVFDCVILQCGGGIYTGGDVGHGLVAATHMSLFNSESVEPPPPIYNRLTGVSDRTELGSTYVGIMLDAIGGSLETLDEDGDPVAGLNVYVTEPTNASTIVGSYHEGQAGISGNVSPFTSVWYGSTSATFAQDDALYGVTLPREWRNVATKTVNLGDITIRARLRDGDGLYGFSASDDATRYSLLRAEPDSDWWGIAHGSTAALAYSGAGAPEGLGFTWAQNGLFLDSPKILVTNADAMPSGAGWRQGDFVINRLAEASEPSWWQCIASNGVTSTWQEGPTLG